MTTATMDPDTGEFPAVTTDLADDLEDLDDLTDEEFEELSEALSRLEAAVAELRAEQERQYAAVKAHVSGDAA